MPTRKRSSDAAESVAQPDNLTSPRARTRPRRRGGALTDDERAEAQEQFLLVYARTANVSQATKRAHISRETFYQWRAHDTAFAARLQHADEDAQDVLRKETFRRAVIGVNEPLTNGQGLIYEMEETLDADGHPALDHRGRPILRRVKIATVKKYSDGLLQAMLKARVPEYRDKKQLEVSGPNGAPIQTQSEHALTINLEGMSIERVRALRALLRDEQSSQDDEQDEQQDQPDGSVERRT